MNKMTENIKEELLKLSKEDLVNIIMGLSTMYIMAAATQQIANTDYIQQCINSVQVNMSQDMKTVAQELKTNFFKSK